MGVFYRDLSRRNRCNIIVYLFVVRQVRTYRTIGYVQRKRARISIRTIKFLCSILFIGALYIEFNAGTAILLIYLLLSTFFVILTRALKIIFVYFSAF